jgi:hypothetical protein
MISRASTATNFLQFRQRAIKKQVGCGGLKNKQGMNRQAVSRSESVRGGEGTVDNIPDASKTHSVPATRRPCLTTGDQPTREN